MAPHSNDAGDGMADVTTTEASCSQRAFEWPGISAPISTTLHIYVALDGCDNIEYHTGYELDRG